MEAGSAETNKNMSRRPLRRLAPRRRASWSAIRRLSSSPILAPRSSSQSQAPQAQDSPCRRSEMRQS
eukprot:7257469-Pyramimonas_sp.AAC.1